MLPTKYKRLLFREWLLVKRDRKKFIGILFIIPIVMTLMFAFSINLDVRHLPTAVFNQSPREEARNLIAAFQNTGYFNIRYAAQSYQEITDLIESGKAKIGIIIPPDFTDKIKRGSGAAVQVIVDDSDFRNVNAAKGAALSIGQIKLQELLSKKVHSVAGKQSGSPFEVRLRNWYNIEGNSKYSILPGVTCAMLLLTSMLIFSLNVATDRQKGVTARLKALGVSQIIYFSVKAVPYVMGAFIQFTILLFIQVFFFDLPFRGNIFLLYLITGIYIVTCLAIAFLVARLSADPSQTSPFVVVIFLVSILLGGFIGPQYGLPDFLYWCGYVTPMTCFLDIMRGIMLKGVGVVELWPSFTGVFACFLLAMLPVSKSEFSNTP